MVNRATDRISNRRAEEAGREERTMKITKEWLKEKSACTDGYKWALGVLDDKPMDAIEFLNILKKAEKFDWANWVIVRVMKRPQYIAYAIYAAEQVFDIFE